MKRVIVFLLLIGLVWCGPIAMAADITILTENSPPSSYMEKDRLTGLSVEIVQEILRRLGRTDTISMVPWARGYQRVLSEANVALFSTTRMSQRESLFAWVGPLYRQRWGLYQWKGSGHHIPNLDAARKVARIGTYRQDAKQQFLQALGFENLVSTNKNLTNITHLKRGDIDLWVSSDFNLIHLAKQAGVNPDNLELTIDFHTVGNYIAFSRQTAASVVARWQATLDGMKADGTYLSICKQYDYLPR